MRQTYVTGWLVLLAGIVMRFYAAYSLRSLFGGNVSMFESAALKVPFAQAALEISWVLMGLGAVLVVVASIRQPS